MRCAASPTDCLRSPEYLQLRSLPQQDFIGTHFKEKLTLQVMPNNAAFARTVLPLSREHRPKAAAALASTAATQQGLADTLQKLQVCVGNYWQGISGA